MCMRVRAATVATDTRDMSQTTDGQNCQVIISQLTHLRPTSTALIVVGATTFIPCFFFFSRCWRLFFKIGRGIRRMPEYTENNILAAIREVQSGICEGDTPEGLYKISRTVKPILVPIPRVIRDLHQVTMFVQITMAQQALPNQST